MAGSGYSAGDRPLGGYLTLTGGFAVAFAGSLWAAKRRRGELPDRLGAWDLVTVGFATHKLTRLIAKERAMAFLRAPFVRHQEGTGQGEVSEQPRGTGLQLAVGELLVCPYCLGQWVASGLAVGLVAAPRLTRLTTFIFTAETIADFLQLAYFAAEERASPG